MGITQFSRRGVRFAAMLAVLSSPLPAQTFFQVSPTGSFYRASAETPSAPLIVPLAGFPGATSLMLQPQGLLQVAGGGSPQHNAVFCGVFSSSTELLASTVQQRVPGALSSTATTASPCISASTFFGRVPTDIAQDFFIPFAGLTVEVPVGASYLFVAVPDDFFSDNVSPDPSRYGVAITARSVPEPASALLLGTGVTILMSLRRRRTSDPRVP